ncbi:MAG TPA: DUF2071 domain-containing protein [Pyrinomonadaceae bacterium]|jgi:hypothetical protein|nr:DUF2071 domain-containing protein [Pyrinomonadaceae bacterium]
MTKASVDEDEPTGDEQASGAAKKKAAKKKAAGKRSASSKSASGKSALSKTSAETRAVGRKKVILDDGVDRETIRQRPSELPLMEHHWGKLLFMHWPIDAERLRSLVPPQLTIDTFDGEAWLGVTPFTMWDVRLSFTPPVPYLSDFHELNVRTYVLYRGVPGVWFFSLNTNSAMTVFGARTFYFLPYFNARIGLQQQGDTIHYDLERTDAARPAGFKASWEIGRELPESEPGTLEFFLTERYCLYSASGESIYRARIHHAPWPLRQATLLSHSSDIVESDYLPKPKGKPLVHYAEALAVDVWPPEKA